MAYEFGGAKYSVSVTYADSSDNNVTKTISGINLPPSPELSPEVAADLRTFARMLVNISLPNANMVGEPKLTAVREVELNG